MTVRSRNSPTGIKCVEAVATGRARGFLEKEKEDWLDLFRKLSIILFT